MAPLQWVARSLASPHADQAAHPENQDNYLIVDGGGRVFRLANQRPVCTSHAHWQPGAWRLAVVDGMGGHAMGRQVAQRLVQALADLPPTSGQDLPRAIEGIHQRLKAHFGRVNPSPGATLTLLEHSAGMSTATLFHVGDSRLLQLSTTDVRLLSIDHTQSAIAAMRRTNSIGHWQTQVFRSNSRTLAQAIGVGNALRGRFEHVLRPLEPSVLPLAFSHLADRRQIALQQGGCYLLATDGLWHHTPPQAVLEHLPTLLARTTSAGTSLAPLADAIVQTHRNAACPDSAGDNASFILFRYQEPRS